MGVTTGANKSFTIVKWGENNYFFLEECIIRLTVYSIAVHKLRANMNDSQI